ncbi:MAG: hypothetical protein J6A38_02980 [Clostridia bacterium]|nr:hypothetical protein [Clostridia bacterium]
MKQFKNYVAPEMFILSLSATDVICNSTQVDIYSDDSYVDGWTDGALKA